MKNLKKLTILHSNDLHGDFLAEQVDEKLVGGVSRLSGYVNKVRNEEKNVIYTISGDMFRGSLIDSEFQGISTIEIMNLLAPDVVTLGNHEVDYGLAHLLFLEKCATFPIINANMYLKLNGVRLFRSHIILKIDGMNVLFIGILTSDVLASTKSEGLIGTMVDIEDAANEVGKICDAYRNVDIDFTVLLTHIGFEEDKKLAAALDPAWGVDLIIGGHSHTYLTELCEVAGIPIVQAAIGTDQIGRFDIMVDTDTNAIDTYTWQCIPITAENCPRDLALEEVMEKYTSITDKKYGRILTRFPPGLHSSGAQQGDGAGRSDRRIHPRSAEARSRIHRLRQHPQAQPWPHRHAGRLYGDLPLRRSPHGLSHHGRPAPPCPAVYAAGRGLHRRGSLRVVSDLPGPVLRVRPANPHHPLPEDERQRSRR